MTKDKQSTLLYLSCITIALFFFSEKLKGTVLDSIAIFLDDSKIKYLLLLLSIIYAKVSLETSKIHKVFLLETRCFLIAFFSLVFTTAYYQIQNGFWSKSIMEFVYILTPFIFVYYIVTRIPQKIPELINFSFVICVLCTFIDMIDKISMEAIYSWDAVNSESSFESGLAFFYVYYEIYYLHTGDRRKGFLCVIMSVITLKRFCLLKAIIIYILFAYTNFKKIDKRLYYATIIFFIISPLFLDLFYRGFGVSYLENLMNKDITEITKQRYERIVMVQKLLPYSNHGLGSCQQILTQFGKGSDTGLNIHCDLLRIYYEGTIVATVIFTISFFLMLKPHLNFYAFLVLFNYFSEGYFNHMMIGQGTTNILILFWLCVFVLNRVSQKTKYEKKLFFYHPSSQRSRFVGAMSKKHSPKRRYRNYRSR